jgi:hypothetical protein
LRGREGWVASVDSISKYARKQIVQLARAIYRHRAFDRMAVLVVRRGRQVRQFERTLIIVVLLRARSFTFRTRIGLSFRVNPTSL